MIKVEGQTSMVSGALDAVRASGITRHPEVLRRISKRRVAPGWRSFGVPQDDDLGRMRVPPISVRDASFKEGGAS